MTYKDLHSMEKRILESWKVERNGISKIPQEVSYLVVSMMNRADEENEHIR